MYFPNPYRFVPNETPEARRYRIADEKANRSALRVALFDLLPNGDAALVLGALGVNLCAECEAHEVDSEGDRCGDCAPTTARLARERDERDLYIGTLGSTRDMERGL